MPNPVVDMARTEVEKKFGAALASKASDQLLLKLAGFVVDGAEAAMPSRGAVLEFEPEDLKAAAEEAKAEIEGLPSFEAFRAGAAEAGPEVLRQALPLNLARPRLVRAAKERFRRSAKAVREALETSLDQDRDAFGLESTPHGTTRTCWLNATVRTAGTTPALADVASDDGIRKLDVPRRLSLDVNHTAGIVGAPAFRNDSGLDGSGIIVGVIDTEVAVSHTAFGGRAEAKGNFTAQPFGTPHSHGTAVAGIIGSEDEDFPGIAPGVTLWTYKIFPAGTDFEGALAIQQALEDGVQVINCSWGAGPAADGTSREAVACNNAWALGLMIVKSAGNRGPESGTLTSPADADGILVVGACDRDGKRMEDYSSRGPTGHGLHRPHLAAPGGRRFGTGIFSARPTGGFGDAGPGTSFAAPHAAGLAALLLEQDPTLEPDAVRDALIASCHPLADGSQDDQGSGLVRLVAAADDDEA